VRSVPNDHRILLWFWSALCVVMPACCYVTSDDFEAISEYGFDPVDHEQDINTRPWSMAYFVPDGAEGGHVYVGTGNNLTGIMKANLGLGGPAESAYRPPEIRRYRPDLGPKTWERVFDYRDVETGPPWQTSGVRSLAVYRAQSDEVTYLYAGTYGREPALWRSATGAPGSWERVWTHPVQASLRGMAVHNDLLYFAVTYEGPGDSPQGELYVTDGETFRLVDDDGFGNPFNRSLFSLASFNGWLYAGTYNVRQGYEVWKLEGPDGQTDPIRVIAAGGSSRANSAASQMQAFKGRLYVASLIWGGFNTLHPFKGGVIRGADMVRIDADDNMETLVGPRSVARERSGFGEDANVYFWSLAAHDGKLYCGTMTVANGIPYALSAGILFPGIGLGDAFDRVFHPKYLPDLYDLLTANGADLFCSEDGVHWQAVFTNGLGNADNYGLRNLLSAEGSLFVGFCNLHDGLVIHRQIDPLP